MPPAVTPIAPQSLPHPAAATPAARAPGALSRLLAEAGIQVDGGRPWDLEVHHPRLYRRVLWGGSLGLGDAYVDGDWDCDQLDELFTRLLRHDLDRRPWGLQRLRMAWALMDAALHNPQAPTRAFVVGERHYDLGNDLFERMLDPLWVYSCGWWAHAATLEEAQRHKLELVCRKLELKPGMTLLDIGCGWGGLAWWAATHHGVRVTGITVSREQQAHAQRLCTGLPVEIRLADYRTLHAPAAGRFDRIVSVGMFEHVGPKNARDYFDTARRLLAPDGLFLLHTIGVDRPQSQTDPWIERHIFPGGKLPAAGELATDAERRFVIEDWHNFGPDYDRTLMAWHARFEAAWPDLAPRYGERFRRMWRYYLLSCAGFFRSRQGQLWQLVLSPRERGATYRSVRPAAVGMVGV
jgi:cyclopropane-fatty-acyl-phospholipid synthase